MAYTPQWEPFAGQVIAIAGRVAQQFPRAWAKATAPHDDGEYIRRVAWACHQVDARVGLNGKRGNLSDISLDALAFPNPSGARDTSGKWGGVEIVDIIGGHETPNARLLWIDVTQATIDGGAAGGWVQPRDLGGNGGPVKPIDPPQPRIKSRSAWFDDFARVNDFYAAPEGLQRPGGMVLDGQADIIAMMQWGYDLLTAKVEDVVATIRRSEEWRRKHPGETP